MQEDQGLVWAQKQNWTQCHWWVSVNKDGVPHAHLNDISKSRSQSGPRSWRFPMVTLHPVIWCPHYPIHAVLEGSSPFTLVRLVYQFLYWNTIKPSAHIRVMFYVGVGWFRVLWPRLFETLLQLKNKANKYFLKSMCATIDGTVYLIISYNA